MNENVQKLLDSFANVKKEKQRRMTELDAWYKDEYASHISRLIHLINFNINDKVILLRPHEYPDNASFFINELELAYDSRVDPPKAFIIVWVLAKYMDADGHSVWASRRVTINDIKKLDASHE